MTVAPFSQALMVASSSVLEPPANFSNSKTPAGPFQRIVLAEATVSAYSSCDLGPASSPIHPSGIPDSSVAVEVCKINEDGASVSLVNPYEQPLPD